MMIRRSHSMTRRSGITLLEVLVSMAIFLIAFAGITQLMDIASTNALDAMLQSDATRLAQSKLAEVEAGVITPDASSSGTFDLEAGWEWNLESMQSNVPNVSIVTVTVKRQSGRQIEFKLSQMLFDSRQMGNSSEVVKPTTTTGAAAP
jgi:general secretion pathway protein I